MESLSKTCICRQRSSFIFRAPHRSSSWLRLSLSWVRTPEIRRERRWWLEDGHSMMKRKGTAGHRLTINWRSQGKHRECQLDYCPCPLGEMMKCSTHKEVQCRKRWSPEYSADKNTPQSGEQRICKLCFPIFSIVKKVTFSLISLGGFNWSSSIGEIYGFIFPQSVAFSFFFGLMSMTTTFTEGNISGIYWSSSIWEKYNFAWFIFFFLFFPPDFFERIDLLCISFSNLFFLCSPYLKFAISICIEACMSIAYPEKWWYLDIDWWNLYNFEQPKVINLFMTHNVRHTSHFWRQHV